MRVIFDINIFRNLENGIIYMRKKDDLYNNKQKYGDMWKDCPVEFIVYDSEEDDDDFSYFVWKKNGEAVCMASKVSFEMFKDITNYYFTEISS